MPPRAAKKSIGPGRRGGRTRGTPKAAQPELEAVVVPEDSVKAAEGAPDEVKEEEVVKVEEVNEEEKEKVVDDDSKTVEEKPVVDNRIDATRKEDKNTKVSVEEFKKGEWLDLEDNDPEESDPEEDVGVDYDEKEILQEDIQEEVDDMEEEDEDGDVGEDEESDMPEEEMEDPPEELEPEEEHAEMVDGEEQEHHDVFKERRKRKEFEIFVGGLDKDATEEDLRKVFGKVGEVTEVRLMMNAQTKKNKGFAFLRFATVEQAKRACAELKNPVVKGKKCGITPSQDSDTLFLGNICKTWTKEALKEKLKHYGINTVEDLTLVGDSKTDGTNRGFAFLEFSSRSDAMDAFKRLQKRDAMFGVDRPAKVSFADSFIDPGDEIMAQVKTVFLDGLPASWDEDRVRAVLKIYGDIEKIELARNMPAARRKDFGFITFDSHDAAVTCARSINNEELGGQNKAKVRARLSRPLQKGKGKHVSHGDFQPGRTGFGRFRGAQARAVPRNLPPHGIRRSAGRMPPVVDHGIKRPVGYRDRRPVMTLPPRGRPMVPLPRSYDRRLRVPPPPKSSLKRDYGRREELPPRNRVAAVFVPPRSASERRSSYRDDYPSRRSAYADLPRGSSCTSARRAFVDEGYGPRFERPPPNYREGRPCDYDSLSGSKRPYAALDDIPPRCADTGLRQSRACLDYEVGTGASQYEDACSDRLWRSNIGYSSSRSSISSQDSRGVYSSRQGITYGGASYNGSDVGRIYSSSFDGDYMSRAGDVGGSSYSSPYSGRSLGSSGYMGGGDYGSYY